jgi:hypothetical protein
VNGSSLHTVVVLIAWRKSVLHHCTAMELDDPFEYPRCPACREPFKVDDSTNSAHLQPTMCTRCKASSCMGCAFGKSKTCQVCGEEGFDRVIVHKSLVKRIKHLNSYTHTLAKHDDRRPPTRKKPKISTHPSDVTVSPCEEQHAVVDLAATNGSVGSNDQTKICEKAVQRQDIADIDKDTRKQPSPTNLTDATEKRDPTPEHVHSNKPQADQCKSSVGDRLVATQESGNNVKVSCETVPKSEEDVVDLTCDTQDGKEARGQERKDPPATFDLTNDSSDDDDKVEIICLD